MTIEELLEKYAMGVLEFQGANFAEANLSGIKLTNVKFIDANFSVANMSGIILVESDLSYAKLNVARLSGATLTGSILNNCSFNVANLMRADMSRTQLRNCSFIRAELIRTDFSRADMYEANLNSADLREASLQQANLRYAILCDANLRAANLREGNLEMANLSGSNLTATDMSGTNLRDAEMRQANLCMANLSGADLSGANLRWADLRGANLIWADLTGAKLSGANLQGADLTNANLSDTSLVHTNLTQAKLINVEWMGSDLTGSTLTGAKLYGTSRFGLKIDNIKCEWVDLSPDGDRSIIQKFNEDELKDFFNATPPTIRIVIDLPLEYEANFVIAGTYYQIAEEYSGLIQPPSIESGPRKTAFTFRVESDEALLPSAFMTILPFKDANITQKVIYYIVDIIRQEAINTKNSKLSTLAKKLVPLLEQAINKSKNIKQTKKNLEVAAKLNFAKAPTQTIITNSSAQSLVIYDHPNFGKKFVKRMNASSEHNISESEYIMPSINMILNFVENFYVINQS
ncbi:MAG: pentapeptide repeat-containing protein [Sphaerospermopsis sp. SIO1G2]|nr:pentapeptide repeat-containing protein [Sphaerospermopsis sp. SIO1G1]NET72413.1 pentapeptide repeat-containing protein [Sphaerospermopsis sp. SIO1G2]